VRLFRRKERADAKRLFGFSILYLFLLFAALLGEHLTGVRPLALLR
jgi:protoheme IX farnesyltransferase